MKITIEIEDNHVRELISEAGSGHWARDLVFVNDSSLAFAIIEHEGIHDPGDGGETKHEVTEEMIVAGLTKMANAKPDEGGHHFADVRDYRLSDMYTGDAIIQFAIFGELRYV